MDLLKLVEPHIRSTLLKLHGSPEAADHACCRAHLRSGLQVHMHNHVCLTCTHRAQECSKLAVRRSAGSTPMQDVQINMMHMLFKS